MVQFTGDREPSPKSPQEPVPPSTSQSTFCKDPSSSNSSSSASPQPSSSPTLLQTNYKTPAPLTKILCHGPQFDQSPQQQTPIHRHPGDYRYRRRKFFHTNLGNNKDRYRRNKRQGNKGKEQVMGQGGDMNNKNSEHHDDRNYVIPIWKGDEDAEFSPHSDFTNPSFNYAANAFLPGGTGTGLSPFPPSHPAMMRSSRQNPSIAPILPPSSASDLSNEKLNHNRLQGHSIAATGIPPTIPDLMSHRANPRYPLTHPSVRPHRRSYISSTSSINNNNINAPPLPLNHNRSSIWTVEALASYVQNELAPIIHRLAYLENHINQIATSHGAVQAPILPSAPSSSSIGMPGGSNTFPLTDPNHRTLSIPISVGGGGGKEITRGHLDRYCLPTLEHTPDPSLAIINRIAHDLESIYGATLDRKTIVSQIRKWFRKRREEMGSRIISALKRHRNLSEEQLLAESDELIERLQNDEFDLTPVINDARLELSDERVAKPFAKQKLLSFLRRRLVKYEEQ